MISNDQDILEIENMIYIIRGNRVMLDNDLAKLYGVETRALNQAVKRNLDRFPEDFMFTLSHEEFDSVKISSQAYSILKYRPNAFTENGVAMLSSVLSSKKAIHINILIIRTFTKLRSFLSMESALHERIGEFEESSTKLFKIVFERLDSLEEDITPKLPVNRKKIGLKRN
ncbi:ORF6N domain-containing protein [Bacteriovorax sp. PP10]|uniref:ORF6N domain-containing protein n=1 Tax=Bacteriovorax antarcticus TaxID=3088717 RepID=A0ABU5W0V5_9BACT|nr:ORF6N domain-containing protein [Bacteriovorax sp. PP10]MEA9358442.1 ORF6N domain-containing protein [Bacteriovorax sp. PP10]